MARAVVTGGAGFLGSHLCESLLRRGDDVVCVDDLSTGAESNLSGLLPEAGFVFVCCDVSDRLEIDGAVDAVLHFASPASPMDYLEMPFKTLTVNSRGTHNALELARAKGARFLLASTSEVYGDPLEHPQQENYLGHVDPVGPRSVYDEAKRFAEAMTAAYHRHHGLDTAIARIFNTYGPRMRPNDGRVVSSFIAAALQGHALTVFGDGEQTRSFCYVDDTIRGLLALLDSRVHMPVNIGNPDEMTVNEFADIVLAVTGSSSPRQYAELPQGDPKRRCPDTHQGSDHCWVGHPRQPSQKAWQHTTEWFRSRVSQA